MGTPRGGLHQVECRWNPNKDMYPIAWSERPSPAVHDWYGRLAGFVRPYRPAPDVPAASFVYITFPDGMSAAIWRKWDQRAIPLGGESDRQSLVARILFGHVTTLPPDTALALGAAGWPAVAGPVPGQVRPDDRLPMIPVGDLSALVARAGGKLEASAARLQGLEFLLAEAMRHSTTPLSVLLPKRYMTKPVSEGPQAPMLWAMLHTVRPLLDRPDDPGGTVRAWTFSTYEPPLGASDTRWLANIVFRADQQAPPPQITRSEITVRPWDPGQHPPPDEASQVARLLDAAYRQIGGEQIGQFLAAVAADHPDPRERLAFARQRLAALVGERPSASNRDHADPAAVPRPVPDASLGPETRAAFGERGDGQPGFEPPASEPPGFGEPGSGEPAYAETAQETRSYAAPYQDRILQEHAYQEYEDGPSLAGAPSYVSPADSDQQARARDRRSVADSRDPRVPDGQYRTGVLDLMQRLTLNQEEPAFREAIAALWHGDGPVPSPADRAKARYSLARRGWFLPILMRHDPQCVHPVLTTLFGLTVIPDLPVQGVADDVARWAGEFEAPPAVIQALAAAAAREGDDCSRLLGDVLRSALSWRWLSEHGIRDDTARPPAGMTARVASHRRSPDGPERGPAWPSFAGESRGVVIASPVAWLCLLQVIVLVVVLLRL